MDAAWDQGIRLFDAAPQYGLGLGEMRLGAGLAGRPRDEYVLSTKVGRLLRADAPPNPDDFGPGRPAVRQGDARTSPPSTTTAGTAC